MSNEPAAKSSWPTVIGQAAAIITIASAAIFTTGNLVLYARSWFQMLPWSTLLQEFSVIDLQLIGAAAFVPALTLGAVWGYLADVQLTKWCKHREGAALKLLSRNRWIALYALPFASVCLTAAATPASIWVISRTYENSTLYRPLLTCFWVPLVAGLAFFLLVGLVVPPIIRLNSNILRRLWLMALTTAVLIPAVASLIATPPFPAVQVCTKDGNSTTGRLVGSSASITYVANTGNSSLPRSEKPYVTAIPESEINRKYIGTTDATCPVKKTPGE